MVMKTALLSKNLVLIIEELLTNQRLMKFLKYPEKDPLVQPVITNPKTDVFLKHIYPTPFIIPTDPNASTNVCQLHIYYGFGDLDGPNVEDVKLYFDIAVSKNIWLCNIEEQGKGTGKTRVAVVRPYVIMTEIIDTLGNKSIDTVGKISFKQFRHIYVNEYVDVIQIASEVTNFTSW